MTLLGWSALGISVQVILNSCLLFLGRLSKVQIALGVETSEEDLCDSTVFTWIDLHGCSTMWTELHSPELPSSHVWPQNPYKEDFCASIIYLLFLKSGTRNLLFLIPESVL